MIVMSNKAIFPIKSLIVLFTSSLSLIGMDSKYTLLKQEHANEHPYDLACVNKNFAEGILHYQRGNKTVAGTILFGTYQDAEDKNILHLVNETLLMRVRSMISITQYNANYYKTALLFSDDPEDQQKIYRRMAKKAYREGNFSLGQKYVCNALEVQKKITEQHEKIVAYDREIAAKEEVIDYEKQQSEQQKIKHEAHQSKLKNEFAISKIINIDPGHPDFPCVLAAMNLENNQKDRSYTQSIEYAKRAVINLTHTRIDTPISFRYEIYLPRTLKSLHKDSGDQTIQSNALMLQQYYEMLFALKEQNTTRLQELSTSYKTKNRIQAIPLQLLCSAIDTPRLCSLIQDFMLEDPEFIEFYRSSERELAVSTLTWGLNNLKLTQKEKDLYHLFIGGCEYHRKHFKQATSHFEQCSDYEKNIYLKAVKVKISTPETYYEDMASILPLLQKSLSIQEKNEKIIRAHEIIATACEYDPSLPIDEIISRCEEIILRTLSSADKDPFGHGYILLACADANKKNELLATEQEKIKTIASYFTFFDALQSNDRKKLDQFFSAKDYNNNAIRLILFKNIRNKNKNDIQEIIFEDESFRNVCLYEKLFIKKLFNNMLDHKNVLSTIKSEDLHYILGGIASIQKNDAAALEHFSHCNQNDPYIVANIIQATNIGVIRIPLKKYLSLSKTKTPTTYDNASKKAIAATELLKGFINHELITACLDAALKEENYKYAYTLIDYFIQLDFPEIYSSLCNCFVDIEKSILQLPTSEYKALLAMPDRINTRNTIQKKANQKHHNACFCNCLAYSFIEHSEHSSHTKKNSVALKRECLHYLSCRLKHEIIVSETDHQNQLNTCGHLALFFGAMDDSPDLIDLAIKCGNPSALRTKAMVVGKKKSKNSFNEMVKLLEQHAKSNDDPAERALSYNELGKILYGNQTKLDLKTKNLTFDYFKAAADLGNYQKGHLLSEFYVDGVEGHQVVDIEKALFYLEKTIELNEKDSYGEALYLHASICYADNQYKRAQATLEKLIARTDYSDIEKLLSYWLMGLTQLNLLDEHTNLSQEALSCLRKAYVISADQYVLNPDTFLVENLTLCNHEPTIHFIEKKINHILQTKKNDVLSLEFCALMGCTLFQQCEKKPITDRYRQLALSALIYAAQHNSADAALWLINVTDDEVKLWDKIYYIALLSTDDLVGEIAHSTLQRIYPTEVIGQAQLIHSFAEKNNVMLLKKYLMQLYQNHMPIVLDPIHYRFHSHNDTKNILQKCLQITVLIEAATSFLKNPMKPDPLQHFAAIFLGSLLTYSLDSKELVQGALYLETSRKNFPGIHIEQIEKNLGHIYYKLGSLAQEEGKQILATEYFKKGILLKDKDCISASKKPLVKQK